VFVPEVANGTGAEDASRKTQAAPASPDDIPPTAPLRAIPEHLGRRTSEWLGTTHIVLEPVDFMARLAALVPPPRAHLTRFHGVFAPHAALRAAVTPVGRGSRAGSRVSTPERPKPRQPRHMAMS